MRDELKPCPFCGDDMKFASWERNAKDSLEVLIAPYCIGPRCGVRGSMWATHEDAIAAWNTRAQQGRGDRERIARIIEPNAWRERERFLAHLRGENLPGEPGMDEMIKRSAARRVDAVVAPSLAKADAILASLVDDGGVK